MLPTWSIRSSASQALLSAKGDHPASAARRPAMQLKGADGSSDAAAATRPGRHPSLLCLTSLVNTSLDSWT